MSARIMALVESNTTGTGPEFARAAEQLGVRPVFLVDDPGRYPFLREGRFAVVHTRTGDDDAVVDACHALALDGEVVGVTSSSEYFVVRAARAARTLGLPGPEPDALARCRDKEAQRSALARAGVTQPHSLGVGSVAAALEAGEALGYPVVLKPAEGSGKVGVARVDNPREMESRVDALLARTANERGIPVPPRALVEELVEGPEFSCETFDRRVVGITRKHLGAPPHFVEMGHDFPAPLDLAVVVAVGEAALCALSALGLGWGAAHTELRLTPTGPSLIEVNPRLAGGLIPALVDRAIGVDLVGAQVARACGAPVEPAPRRAGAASIRFLVPPRPGVLVRMEGMESACALRHVDQVESYCLPGDRVQLRGDFRDRIGHVIASAETAEICARAAERAREALIINVAAVGAAEGARHG
jgi:biotin carboxylase